jgi:hypothetical protein
VASERPHPSARDEGWGSHNYRTNGTSDRSTASSVSALERLLSQLQRVRQTSPCTWTASCPAHEDKDPSLSIRALSDGRLLIHDFAGCSASEVVGAVGMELADLMGPRRADTPDGPGGHGPGPPAWRTKNLLAEAAHEALIVAIAMESQWRGEDLSLEDEDRVFEAVQRLRRFAYDTR